MGDLRAIIPGGNTAKSSLGDLRAIIPGGNTAKSSLDDLRAIIPGGNILLLKVCLEQRWSGQINGHIMKQKYKFRRQPLSYLIQLYVH